MKALDGRLAPAWIGRPYILQQSDYLEQVRREEKWALASGLEGRTADQALSTRDHAYGGLLSKTYSGSAKQAVTPASRAFYTEEPSTLGLLSWSDMDSDDHSDADDDDGEADI